MSSRTIYLAAALLGIISAGSVWLLLMNPRSGATDAEAKQRGYASARDLDRMNGLLRMEHVRQLSDSDQRFLRDQLRDEKGLPAGNALVVISCFDDEGLRQQFLPEIRRFAGLPDFDSLIMVTLQKWKIRGGKDLVKSLSVDPDPAMASMAKKAL